MPTEAPSNTTTCTTCGGALPGAQVAGGHCSRCLFKITFGEEDELLTQDEVPWTRLASCELFEEIGRGGMGVVYRARQRGLDRVVAVKVLLRAPFAGAEERERFHREAQAAARLRHPGIVSIIDVGEDDGVPWFSMEHIAGKSLEQLVREHPMDAHEAARCVRRIAEALQHAHDHGVLHRDLKPSNILLDEENAPHITDFGIARIGTSGTTAAQLTHTGQMLGSPGYAAPEQALAGSADVRTDVYGLGALLYHLLTGRPPFQGPTLNAILVQLRESEPLSPRKLNPSVPLDLETICLKCLQKAPEARYASATAAADDLGRFLDGSAILARPISLPGRLWRWTRRHPGIAAMLAIIILLISGLIGGSLAFARHQARMEHRTSLISEARSLRQTRLAGSRTEALSKLREAWAISPSDEIRTETIACLALPEIGRLSRERVETPNLTRSADGMREALFDAGDLIVRETTTKREIARIAKVKPASLVKLDDHGERIAIAEPQSGTLRLIALADQRVIATCEHPLFLHGLDWAGDLIATGCDNRFIYIWDDQGRLKHRLSGHEAPSIRVAFRPRSQELASTSADAHVRLWHAARGVEIVRREVEHRPHNALWWSTDGARLFGAVENESAEVFEMPASSCFTMLAPPQEEPHSENLGSATFSSDGRLAAVIDEESLRVWDFDAGRLIHQQRKTTGQWLSALFSPDGTKLWTCGWADELTERPLASLHTSKVIFPGQGSLLRDVTADGSQLLLSNNGLGLHLVVPADGSKPVRIKHPGTLASLIAPDGRWLITSSYQTPGAKVWSLPEGRLLHTLCETESVTQIIALGRDRVLLKVSGTGRLFRVHDWKQERQLPASLRLNCLAASRDGTLLATLDNHEIRLLETTAFTEVLRLTFPAHIRWPGECHLLFDAEARHLLAHTALGSVCRWDLRVLMPIEALLVQGLTAAAD
jgi:eukaryotic-like serine/threonine-protein kinase